MALAEKKKCRLNDLLLAELQTIYPDVNTAVFDVLTVEKSVKSRKSFGRTAPLEVLRQIAYWKRYLVSV
ncbi:MULTISPECIES: hypothetical protein [Bartonella]|uniref:hypothetical protein n=1 Tax=Bartonella TaxID=773 RepID=UPI001FE77A03|nr:MULTISPECIES: hypothetical protein [Bartonella]